MKRLAMVFSVVSPPASAYEITTHALVTDHAYRLSTLNPHVTNSIAPVLGFDRLDADRPFAFQGQSDPAPYYDDVALADPLDNLPPLSSASSVPRYPEGEDRNVLNALVMGRYIDGENGSAIEQQVRSWLVRGAIREDDNDFKVGIWIRLGERDDDPYGFLFRAFRHFYDPLLNRASDNQSLCADYGCVKSIAWALGRTNPLSPLSDADDTGRRNHFTWQDARNNYWWALTLKRTTTGVTQADALVSSQERLHRWATAIKSIGHVIHLLQDTAQPQHVRNDLHGPPLTALFNRGEGATDAAFEAFTDYRVIRSYDQASSPGDIPEMPGNPLLKMNEMLPGVINLPFIRLGASNYYPGGGRVRFSTPVEFFTTRHVEIGIDEASLRSRRGLADISNRSFFTSGTLPGFRECQPPGVSSCAPTPEPTYLLPPNDLTAPGYTEVSIPSGLRVHGRTVHLLEYAYPITDAIAPNYEQTVNTLSAYGGKAPLATKSIWYDVTPTDMGSFREILGTTITYNNLRYMADVMLPRAVGYSAGMIDFFFRGRLDVKPIDMNVFAVLNQGDAHTVDATGYPRRTGNPNKIFGFEVVRLKVRNKTEDIVESGTGDVVPQATGGSGARLVAIARYHRNTCYRPDLSGERVRAYDGTISEPACNTATLRSAFQEISVSAPLTVAAGELDGEGFVEKRFDFSSDPIPVNATDLFIQVAYRGKLGDEADGIALGTYDASEPTFAAFWNNTDYFWSGTQWAMHSATQPQRVIDSARICSGAPSQYIYAYSGSTSGTAMGFAPTPGYVRLALLFGKPTIPNQRFTVRGVPAMISSPHALLRSGFTRGQVRQASREHVAASAMAAPFASCVQSPPPSNIDSWCFDPVQRRRGVAFGDIAQPLYYAYTGGEGTDVDSVPLPSLVNPVARSGGTVVFNLDTPLIGCPAQPTGAERSDDIDLLEAAAAIGIE